MKHEMTFGDLMVFPTTPPCTCEASKGPTVREQIAMAKSRLVKDLCDLRCFVQDDHDPDSRQSMNSAWSRWPIDYGQELRQWAMDIVDQSIGNIQAKQDEFKANCVENPWDDTPRTTP